jgi:membrane protein YqaA with SNARE-associated domain
VSELLLVPPAAIEVFGVGVVEFLRRAVASATGWPGLVIIAVYSFLIAFVLPGPSEVVLVAPLNLGLGKGAELGIVILVSGVAKAAGSVVAFRVGHGIKEAGPVLGFFERHGIDLRAWSERQTVRLAERYGYVGLALALCVPGFPDTLSIYAFTVLEEDYVRFAAATFAGSVGRLLVTLFVVGGTLWAF